MKRLLVGIVLVALTAIGQNMRPAFGDEIPEKYKTAVDKGLQYLVKQQFKDGHFGANGDQYPVSMTGLAGIAMLMEGSTVREGKYATNIRKAADWLMERSMKGNNRDGLIGNPDHPTETGRYMYGHGFGTLFLALTYGDEEDRERREKLKDILTRAVKYIGAAQSTQGGWFYTSKMDGHDQDEGSVTITQMQPLRACRNAGIPVPKQVVKKGYDYLKHSTTQRGGVVYSLGRGGVGAAAGGERPALTAAAIACLFSAGEYKDELVKKWFKYCQTAIPVGSGVRLGHDEMNIPTSITLMGVLYPRGRWLGENVWPNAGGAASLWTAYRRGMFDHLVQTQNSDGSWPGGGGFSVGPVYSTAIYCVILQLDRGAVPFFQR